MELVDDDRGDRPLARLNCLRRVGSRFHGSRVSRFSNAARRGIDESAATSAHYTINEPINELGATILRVTFRSSSHRPVNRVYLSKNYLPHREFLLLEREGKSFRVSARFRSNTLFSFPIDFFVCHG